MRTYLPAVVLLLALFAAQSAHAQLRADVPTRPAGVAVYEQPTGFGLGQLFNSDNFRLSHSYELSYNSFGGQGIGLGLYTSSLRFQPSDRLAARVDIGVAHSPFGSSALQQQFGFNQDQPAQVFIQNASLAYRPSENSIITFSFQQSPYGSYYSPFGHGYSPFGSSSMRIRSADHDAMFFRPLSK
jgi:hypothetical protein